MRWVIALLGSLLVLPSCPVHGQQPAQPLLRLKLQGTTVEGLALSWSRDEVALLARDGRLWQFDPREASQVEKPNGAFRPYSVAAMRQQLLAEFGSDFEVSTAGPYLVLHPRGSGAPWARRFEELYRSFWHYFSVRGFTLREPQFPLVAVVLRNREEFYRVAQRDSGDVPLNLAGYYSPQSNRVTMYDGSSGSGDRWHENARTIVHEATHQTAFNTGIHNRLRPTPRWLAEGLGTLFEAPGVYNARYNPRAEDRINRQQLAAWRDYRSRQTPQAIAELIASDAMFRDDTTSAYALAWALTYYLVETQPRKFAEYLQRVADGPPLRGYPGSQRVEDFVRVFGDNFPLLHAQMVRHLEQVR
jgi:hypothetical protein